MDLADRHGTGSFLKLTGPAWDKDTTYFLAMMGTISVNVCNLIRPNWQLGCVQGLTRHWSGI